MTTKHLDYYREIFKALYEFNVEYVLVGGIAINYHGVNRFTKDLDLFVKPTPENVEKLKQALHAVFEDKSIDEITSDDSETYPVVRYGTPAGFYVDILFRIGDGFRYEDLDWEQVLDNNVPVRVATPESLIAMKQDTGRLQDKADANILREILRRREKR